MKNIKEAQKYLRQAYRLDELINSSLKELEQLREMSTCIKSIQMGEKVKGSSRADETANTVIKIVDLERQINGEIDRFVNLKKEIREKISQLKNKDEELVLKGRYLNFDTWEVIAEEMGFSTQWTHEIHKRGLKNFLALDCN